MFTKEQITELQAPLDGKRVRTRKQAGRDLSYVEGWWAIAEANRIFGFAAWDRETLDLRQLGEPREVDGKWRVGYLARVRITVHGEDRSTIYATVREGTGYGSGIDRDMGSAHESAIKEAETDAMKRALMTFGNPFGLALYDKEQREVTHEEDKPKAPEAGDRVTKAKAWAASNLAKIARMDADELNSWSDQNHKTIADLRTVSAEAHEGLMAAIRKRFDQLSLEKVA